MKEIHDWAPWFRELARAVLDAGETGLITQASRVDWGGKPELLRNGDAGIDPFSFFYSLAQKSTKHQRSRVYPSVAKCFGLAPPPDPDNQDLYVFPTPTPQTPVVFNDRREFRADLLWRLFRQAVEDEPQIDPELFRDVLEIKFVAIVKLTQTLFLINPDYFVPADALQRLTVNRSMDLKRCGHAEYVSATGKAKRTFPECRPYEINAFVWFQYMSRSPLITAESRYFQVSTRAYKDDRWPDFDQSYAVYTDASRPGAPPGSWREETTDGDPLRGPYPLAEPKRGDVILVRAGFEGRAIGVVHSNDYAKPDGLNERSRVHVYWINKASASFGGAQTDQKAFARTQPGSSTYRAFATATAYEPTFALLNIDDPPSEAWSGLLNRIERCRAAPNFEADEVTYKVEVAAKVNAARERLRSGGAGWEDLLRHAFTHKLNNLTNYRSHDPFLKWMTREPGQCRGALHSLWSVDGTPEERLQGFCDQVPTEILGTLGGRLNTGTFLLMAEDVHRLPPAKIDAFRRAWKLAGRGNGPTGAEPGAVYGEILRFLDDLVRDGHDWPVPLRDRLDAQGAVWWATRDEGKNGPDPPPRLDLGAYALEHARQDLFLPADEIESLVKLLKRKRNLVLQGPPGTGKTYAAQRLAWLLAGERSTERIEAVQFHQSYGYEDFVRGYRPTDTGGFDLQDGPFLRFCTRAREAPDRPHVLIIDEINRGNLSRIFGELLMLIEADKRDPAWAVRTAYARPDEPAFHVPANLHLVGTMNTADRSLALVDYALRRRFAFSTVEPAFGSQGFDRHLADGGVLEPMRRRIRTRLEALNRQIREHPQLGAGFQIGHSYFCRPPKGLADAAAWNGWYTDVLRYEIEPLLREYWFDDAERARNALAALRAAD